MKKTIIRNILQVLAVGGTAAAMVAVSIAMAFLAVWIFCMIPAAIGYKAVALFALALLSAAAALAGVYVCGYWIVRTGNFSK